MKYRTIIWRNVTRNPRRAVLTVISIGFSLFLIVFLRTLIVELTSPNPDPVSTRRAVVRRSTSLQEDMPEAYRMKIESVPEVRLVLAMDWFGGIYREPANFFANFSVDRDKVLLMFPEIRLDASAREAFLNKKTAAFCGAALAKRFGWKIGDRITLLGTIYPVDLEFTLVGIYTSEVEERTFYFRRDYFQESLGNPGRVGAFYILCESAGSVPRVIEAVDSLFRNSDAETLTETERAFEAGFTSMLGNIQGLVISVSSVIVFMILLVAGNTMAMSIRERVQEIAILKSLGFQEESLIGILVGEALFISAAGGVLGCLGAWGLFASVDMTDLTMGMVREFRVSLSTLGLGFAIAVLVGLLSGSIPALMAAKIPVAEGLRRIG